MCMQEWEASYLLAKLRCLRDAAIKVIALPEAGGEADNPEHVAWPECLMDRVPIVRVVRGKPEPNKPLKKRGHISKKSDAKNEVDVGTLIIEQVLCKQRELFDKLTEWLKGFTH